MALSPNAQKTVSILGCSGSIGTNTIQVLEEAEETYALVALTAYQNAEKLIAYAQRFRPQCVAIADPSKEQLVKEALSPLGITVLSGEQGVAEAAQQPADWIMSAIVGEAGMMPTYHAVCQGTTVALANKESLVCGGELIMAKAKEHGTTIIPVDSEHSALFQTFAPAQRDAVEKLILTASGGPFRTWEHARIAQATPQEALNHPNWDMGSKVTIDSASLMNKGLEVIEAHHLFGFPAQQIDVIIHPESIIHSMVEYADGSVLAQLGTPDMKTPIAVALAWPERMTTHHKKLDLISLAALHFEAVDTERFPCLALAYDALKSGQYATLALNTANEIAVEAFLEQAIHFYHIPELIASALREFSDVKDAIATPQDLLQFSAEVRRYTLAHLNRLVSDAA